MLNTAPAVTMVWTRDIERAKLFYTEKLGLKMLESPIDEIALFEAGAGTRLAVQPSEGKPSEHTIAVFGVKDVVGTVKDLAGRGVKMESYDLDEIKTDEHGIAKYSGIVCAWFKDPDGNLLSVTDAV